MLLRAACRAWGSLCCDLGVPGALCWCAVVLARLCFSWVVVVCAACWPALLVSGWWSFGRGHARLVLLVRRRLRLLSVGVLCWLWSAFQLRLRSCCLPSRGCCCAGACPPPWLGVLCWCVPPPHGGARCVSVCPPHGGACCAAAWPASWSGVLCCCGAPLMVGSAVLVRGPPHGGACCVGGCPQRWLCVLWWCWAWVVVVCAAC